MKKALIHIYNELRWMFINFLYDFDKWLNTSYEDEDFDPSWMDYTAWKETRYEPRHLRG